MVRSLYHEGPSGIYHQQSYQSYEGNDKFHTLKYEKYLRKMAHFNSYYYYSKAVECWLI